MSRDVKGPGKLRWKKSVFREELREAEPRPDGIIFANTRLNFKLKRDLPAYRTLARYIYAGKIGPLKKIVLSNKSEFCTIVVTE